MRKLWYGVLCFFSALLLLLCLGLFLARRSAPPPAYLVRDLGGHVAVYRAGADEPLQVCDIYTHLLPSPDVLRLQQGIPVSDEEQLERLLEDLGL